MNESEEMNEEQRQRFEMQQMKTCQALTTIALIGAPVSLLFGGVLLSAASVVCASVAFAKMHKIAKSSDMSGSVARTLYTQSKVALAASAVACALNLVAFVFMFGAVMQALENGDMSALLNSFDSSAQRAPESGKSIWD